MNTVDQGTVIHDCQPASSRHACIDANLLRLTIVNASGHWAAPPPALEGLVGISCADWTLFNTEFVGLPDWTLVITGVLVSAST
jgi:hypothetical protein